jgi:hypothetical protein
MKYRINFLRKVRRLVQVGPLFCAPDIFCTWDYEPDAVEVEWEELDAKLLELTRAGCVIGSIQPVTIGVAGSL